MKKIIVILAAAVFLLCGGILSLVPEKSYAVEDPDAEIIMLINSLAEYHSRQFTERDASCEIAISQDVREELAARQSCITDMKKRIGARFIGASVKVEGLAISQAENGFEVLFYETTVVDYKYPSSTETDQMEFSVFHKVFLTWDLEIVSDEFSEELTTGFSNCTIDEENIREPSGKDADNNPPTRSEAYTYSAQSAIAYADTYAFVYNTAYPSDPSDCTNFVSQCLHAGGIPFINEGYYSSGWYVDFITSTFSLCWGRASAFVTFWTNQGYSTSLANGSDAYMGNCIPGNPIYWLNAGGSYSGHLMICTGYNSAHIPYINAHTTNAKHIPITNFSNKTLRTIKIVSCSHPYANYTSFGNVRHVIICNSCNNQRLENHEWISYTSYLKCNRCGKIMYL